MFISAVLEVTSNLFRLIYEQLRVNIFILNGNELRKPPMISLLPQIKSIATLLIPNDNQIQNSSINELLNGPLLESLCMSIFEATM